MWCDTVVNTKAVILLLLMYLLNGEKINISYQV